jgi:hypothetical protein
VSAVTYEDLFCLPSRGRFTVRSTKGSGAIVEVKYFGYRGPPITA